MKVIAYSYRADEKEGFSKYAKELNMHVTYVNDRLSLNNVHLVEGHDGVTILGNDDASKPVLERLDSFGIRYLTSRSAGYNNIDLDTAKHLKMKVSNSTYSPNSVADFTVMLMLMLNRRVNQSMKRVSLNDYSLKGLIGNELRNQTIGVIGTGRIGQAVIKNLSGFGGKIIGYDVYQNESIKQYMEYVDLETLFRIADVITLHVPLFESNRNIICQENIEKMKDGVRIINTARGELLNTRDVINALKCGKIGGLAIDVIENEVGIFHNDKSLDIVNHDHLATLKNFQNVIVTPHHAFYTDQAVSDMVECGLKSLHQFYHLGTSPWEIK